MLQVETTNSSGSTPLHVAAYYGSGNMLNLLLHCGADQTHRNKVRQTRDTWHVTRESYICIQLGWGPSHYAHRWAQPTNIKISLGLKPRPPALNSSAFTFRRIKYVENILQL